MLTPAEIAKIRARWTPQDEHEQTVPEFAVERKAHEDTERLCDHIQAQSEQLQRVLALLRVLRDGVDKHCPGGIPCSAETWDAIDDILSSTPAITAYAARVARMEAALRHLAYWQLDLKGTVAEAQSCVQACALAALEGDG